MAVESFDSIKPIGSPVEQKQSIDPFDEIAPTQSQELLSRGKLTSIEEEAMEAEKNFMLSVNTGIPIHEIDGYGLATKEIKQKRGFWKNANLLASRFSDQLHNSTVAPLTQMTSGRDSSIAQDRAYQLIGEWEKKNNTKLNDKLFAEQLYDWTNQLYQKPELRESEFLKGEQQFSLPEEITSPFQARDVVKAEGWADTGVDVLAGLIGFAAEAAILKRAIPSAPEPVIWDTVSVANGGAFGSGASMYGALRFVGSFFPNQGAVSKIGGGLGAGGIFGGTTAIATYAESGEVDVKQTLVNFGLPVVLGYMSITKAEWQSLKPRSKLDLITETKKLIPELKDTPVRQMETAVGELLSDKPITTKIETSGEIKPTTVEQASGTTGGLKPIESTGELAPSQTSLNIIEQAVFNKLVPEGELDPRLHNVLNLKEQARKAVDLVQNEPERASRILAGEEAAPPDVAPTAILQAAKLKAYDNVDVSAVIRLKDADVIDQATGAGQLLVSLREKRKYDPLATAVDVEQARGVIPEQKLTKNLRKAQDNLIKVEKEIDKRGIDLSLLEVKAEKTSPIKVDVTSKEYGSRNRIITKEKYDAAWKRLGETKLNVGIDPARLADVLEIATYHLEAIGRNLPEWSRVLREQFGEKVVPYLDDLWKKANIALNQQDRDSLVNRLKDGYDAGRTLPQQAKAIRQLEKVLVRSGFDTRKTLLKEMHKILKEIDPSVTEREAMDAMSGSGKYKLLKKDEIEAKVRDLNGQFQQVAKLQDMQKGKAPPKTGFERRPPSDEERRLIQQVNEVKKKSGFIVTDPVRQLKSALDTIKTRLKNRISDLKEQITSRKKIVKSKSSQPFDEETIKLTSERDALQKEFDDIFGDRKLTPSQRIKMTTASLEKSIAELQRRIKEKDISPTKKTDPLSTSKLEALRSEKVALQEQLQELKDIANPKKTPEELALQSYKTKLANEKAKYDEMLANEEFETVEKKPFVPDKKSIELKNKRDAAKLAVKTAQELMETKGGITTAEVEQLIKLSNEIERTKAELGDNPTREQQIAYGESLLDFSEYRYSLAPTEHTWVGLLLDVAAVPQSIMTSLDFSFPFRQGWGSMATKEFWQGFGQQYKYAWSEKNLRTLMAEIQGSPRYAIAKKAGLGLTNLGGDIRQLGAREEGMQSTLADKIPAVGRYIRASQRAYTGMADYIRWNRFNNMLDAYTLMKPEMSWTSKQGQQVSKEIAKVINMMTGRGNIWKNDELGNASVAANQVLFSIRKLSADLNMLDPTNYIGFGKYSKLDPFVRRMAQRQLLGSLAITSAVLGLAKMSGAEIETDPTSKQFGMIHIGNRYYDISGGKISMLVFFAQMALAQRKNTDYDEMSELDAYGLKMTAFNYGRSKLAPGASFVADVIFRSDYRGQPVDTPKLIALDAAKRFYPMSIGDTVEMLNDDVTGDIFANTLLNFASEIAVLHGVSVQIHNPEE